MLSKKVLGELMDIWVMLRLFVLILFLSGAIVIGNALCNTASFGMGILIGIFFGMLLLCIILEDINRRNLQASQEKIRALEIQRTPNYKEFLERNEK